MLYTMASQRLFFNAKMKLFDDDDSEYLSSRTKDLGSILKDEDLTTASPLCASSLCIEDDISRDSGISISDDSDIHSPQTQLDGSPISQLSFTDFFRSPVTQTATFTTTRRSLFGHDLDKTPTSSNQSNIRRSLFGSSCPLTPETTPVIGKMRMKRKLCIQEDTACTSRKKVRAESTSTLISCNIKAAFNRQDVCEDLIGDFSRAHLLPTLPGKHADLQSVTPQTIAKLLSGDLYVELDFQIIDCRYPYEYQGGHIRGAINLHTQDQLERFLRHHYQEPTRVQKILIFHCEFSSERGPKRARFIRRTDRQLNAQSYPSLTFPEIYIIHGGYKAFYEQHPDLCTPMGYTPMLKSEHRMDMKKFRSKSKSWSAGNTAGSNYKLSDCTQLKLTY